MPTKGRFLAITFSGDGLFGWMTEEDWATSNPAQPSGAIESASARISALFGHPHQSLFLYAFVLAVLLTPFAGPIGVRMILLALIALTVAWIQMALNQATGGSVHHTILLWPLPQFIIAVSFSAFSYRFRRAGIPAIAVVTAVTALSSALVMNEYFRNAVRNGGGKVWSDAIFPLAACLKQQPPQTWFFTMDWGIGDQIRLLERGKLWIANGTDQVAKPELEPGDRDYLNQIIGTPANIFVAHTKDFEVFPGRKEKLAEFAAAAGYRAETLAVIPDSHGRKVFEVYRFVR